MILPRAGVIPLARYLTTQRMASVPPIALEAFNREAGRAGMEGSGFRLPEDWP